MKKVAKILGLTIASLTIHTAISAQEFKWGFDLTTQFDNREYKSEFNTSAQTLFGGRITPVVGLGWDKYHSVMVGTTLLEEFGSKSFDLDPEFVFYYNYRTHKYNVLAGRFQRTELIGDYSTAFFSDSVRFYDSNLDGFLLQYINNDRGYIELALDWDSRQSGSKREKFTVASAGRINGRTLYAGYHFAMHHVAKDKKGTVGEADHVIDNLWFTGFVGLDFSSKPIWFDKLDIRLGWLQTMQKDRANVEKFTYPNGAQIQLRMEKRNIGVFNSLYLGDNLMPYYHRYGGGLYWGDSFYSTTKDVYNRLELYWEPRIGHNVYFKLASVHHYDGKKFDWQQMATLSVRLNSDVIKFKKNR